MQSQERDLISGLFDRLKPFEAQPRDAEAEAMIRGLTAQQPAAPYLLVQTVLVQEQALRAAQQRITELEAKTGAAAPAAAAGFLGSAPKIGPWGSAPGAESVARPSVPPTRSPLQAAVTPQQQGGSFLRTAMATAAGVAGGALLFEGIRNLMGNNSGAGGGQQQAATGNGQTPPELMPPGEQQQAVSQEPAAQQDYDTASLDDAGSMEDDSWA